jgi:hypothetical protein
MPPIFPNVLQYPFAAPRLCNDTNNKDSQNNSDNFNKNSQNSRDKFNKNDCMKSASNSQATMPPWDSLTDPLLELFDKTLAAEEENRWDVRTIRAFVEEHWLVTFLFFSFFHVYWEGKVLFCIYPTSLYGEEGYFIFYFFS